jgi:uncharacterized protein YjbI with pentapeptide repeats
VFNSLDTSATISVDDSAETQALIGEMIVAHESWVTSSGAEGQRADFSNADLSGLDFSGRNLRGALFSESRLRSARFDRATVDLADFSHSDLTGANFEAASARGANFSGANLRRTDFRNADLAIETSTLDGQAREWLPRFNGCRLEETNFKDAKATRVSASNVTVKKVIADEAFLKLLASGATA